MRDKREHLVSISSERLLVLGWYITQALYLKLYVVLGLLWGLEGVRALIVHFVVQKHEDGTFTFYFFLIVDMLNLLRGLFILLIFVCKRKVWQHIIGYRYEGKLQFNVYIMPNTETNTTYDRYDISSDSEKGFLVRGPIYLEVKQQQQ